MFASGHSWFFTPATERVLELFAQKRRALAGDIDDNHNHGPRNALPEGYAPARTPERLNAVATQIIAARQLR